MTPNHWLRVRLSLNHSTARWCWWAAAAMAAAMLLPGCFRASPDLPPLCRGCNVVVISLDTLRADHLGAYGYSRPTSPHIDKLARSSVVFEDAISQSAWTRPAHASMMTGLYPSEHGIVAMQRNLRLSADVPTLASLLGQRGYATAAFTGGANMSDHYGFDVGFDLFNSPGRRIEDSLEGIERWLAARGTQRYFLFVHGFDAHRPYKSDAIDRRALGLGQARAKGLLRACGAKAGAADMRRFVAEYDAAIHRGDRGVGRLLELIDTRGGLDHTVVVLTSDHGEEFLEHGRCFHIRTLHREILRVPLVVYVPGVSARRVSGVVPASASLPATILDVVGLDGPDAPGPSVAPLLAGESPQFEYVVSETSSHFSEGRGIGHLRALTGNREKLVHFIDQRRYLYYNLADDPLEQNPVARGPGVAKLSRLLERWSAEHALQPVSLAARPIPSRLARELRALGYVD